MHTSTSVIVSVLAQEMAGDSKNLMIEPRETILHRRAPKDSGVALNRRKIKCGQATPWEMLLTQSLTDILDGIPLEHVVRCYEQAIANLKAFAGVAHDDTLLPHFTADLRETRAEGRLNEMQLRYAANPTEENGRQLLAASAAYRAALSDLEAVVTRGVTKKVPALPSPRAA